MHQILVLLAVVTCTASTVSALEPHNAAAAGKSRISACALLIEDLVTKFDTTPSHLRHSGVLRQFKPTEEPVGPNGSYCDDGQIGLQVNPSQGPTNCASLRGRTGSRCLASAILRSSATTGTSMRS